MILNQHLALGPLLVTNSESFAQLCIRLDLSVTQTPA